jgi:hypothetical protein
MGRSSTKGIAATVGGIDSSLVGAGAATTGSVFFRSFGCSALTGVAMTGSTRTGCVVSTAGVGIATFAAGAATLADPVATCCPQFVQNPVPGSILVPHDVQKGFGEAVGAVVSVSSGAAAATAGAVSSTDAGSASSLLPHSVQKTESGSACAPHEEQTGRATVTAAEGCAAAGIGLPHDVQKLADSST